MVQREAILLRSDTLRWCIVGPMFRAVAAWRAPLTSIPGALAVRSARPIAALGQSQRSAWALLLSRDQALLLSTGLLAYTFLLRSADPKRKLQGAMSRQMRFAFRPDP